MREIKFRVWDKTYGRFERVDDTYYIDKNGEFETLSFADERGLQPILMQYTGLKDSKGQEIYEGDIILVRDTKWTVAGHRHATGMIGWMVKDDELHHWYVIDESILSGEVLGHIYETA